MPLRVLSALDSARTQYYHFKAIVIAGMGLFTDAYDLFCIPPIVRLLGHLYHDNKELPTQVTSALVAVALVGTDTTLCLVESGVLPVLAGVGYRRRLPAVGNNHVGVCQQEDTWCVHSGSVFDAGVWDFGELGYDNGDLLHISEGIACFKRLHAGRCRHLVAVDSDDGRRSGCIDLLLADVDAGNC
ncbi:hypothetical protein SLEP1_g41916 [Rubroshorea leprosula]|uniref:Uncharacterized protein n=1 Tax=Rubroshorea leprosula TaxID=152421 RepID=A0AAV5L8P0_9ROSI|nr:hypothetical protein SLEP1_g41916 [Rubroshorea leprosula]